MPSSDRKRTRLKKVAGRLDAFVFFSGSLVLLLMIEEYFMDAILSNQNKKTPGKEKPTESLQNSNALQRRIHVIEYHLTNGCIHHKIGVCVTPIRSPSRSCRVRKTACPDHAVF